MRKIQDLGRRAAALALAAGMTLSVVPGVLAVDADEVLTPPAQTAEQEPETGGTGRTRRRAGGFRRGKARRIGRGGRRH